MKDQSQTLEGIFVYNKAMDIGSMVWEITGNWNYLARDTVGRQWIKSADSIAANIAEGYGRYFFKENRLFCYYSRGSLMESKCWLTKAFQRKLISQEEYLSLKKEQDILGRSLNNYINSIGK